MKSFIVSIFLLCILLISFNSNAQITLTHTFSESAMPYPIGIIDTSHGVQAGRLFRSGISTTCSNHYAPSIYLTNPMVYESYTFIALFDGCINISVTDQQVQIYMALYKNRFNPSDILENCIAEQGSSSPGDFGADSITQGDTLVLVINQVSTPYNNLYSLFLDNIQTYFPTISTITSPPTICPGEALKLTEPTITPNLIFQDSGWEISADEQFTNPIPYIGQTLEDSYYNYYVRFWVTYSGRSFYSNAALINMNFNEPTLRGSFSKFFDAQDSLSIAYPHAGNTYNWFVTTNKNLGTYTWSSIDNHTYIQPIDIQDTGRYNYLVYVKLGDECLGSRERRIEISPCGSNYGISFYATDSEGNQYTTKSYGRFCWMTQNLRATFYSDGSEIPTAIGYSSALYPDVQANINMYGRLYDWYSALKIPVGGSYDPDEEEIQGACPEGWHIPTMEEFNLISNQYNVSELRTNYDWIDGTGNNNSEFNILPAGYYSNGLFYNLKGNSYFITLSETDETRISVPCIHYNCPDILLQQVEKTNAYSLRCIQNRRES